MTLYHIEPVIVPPWTPECQIHEDPETDAYIHVAECGYRIQYPEDGAPTIDYFKRDKPEDFYPVAKPRTVVEQVYGALIFQLAEQIQSLKSELKEATEFDGEIADQAHDVIMSASCSDGLNPGQVESLRHAFTDALTGIQYMHVMEVGKVLRKVGESDKLHAYWYRRACFAEHALGAFEGVKGPVLDAIAVVIDRQIGAADEAACKLEQADVQAAFAGLDRVLAENRKHVGQGVARPEIENLEDYVRAERQRKMTRWAAHAFPDRMTVFDRAKRLLEEAAEAYWA